MTRWGTVGPQVLMIHGGPQGGRAGGAQQFAAQRPLAEAGWRVVAPDRPGHGQSPSRGPEDMELDAVWVAELLGQRSHLLGHSYGGCVALAAAASRPDAVISLTLIEPPLFAAAPNDPDARALREELHRLHTAPDIEPIARLIEFSRAVATPPAPEGSAPGPELLARMGSGLAAMRPPTNWDCAPALARVAESHLPVLVVTGGWSPGFAAVGDAVAACTGGEHRVIGSGHHFPQRLADQFNPALIRFMAAGA